MFAMLNGAWPRVTSDGVDLAGLEAAVREGREPAAALDEATERLVAEVVAAQVEVGMDLVTDGQVRWADPSAEVLAAIADRRTGEASPLVAAWRAASALTEASVAQWVPGPYTLGRRAADEAVARAVAAGETPPSAAEVDEARADVTLAVGDALARDLAALAVAGCRMVLVDEPDAVRIGDDDAERALFAGAGTRLLADAGDLHAMLLVTGGSADAAGVQTIFGPSWHSILVDLIAGPDNWRLVRGAPGDRGIVCAALTVRDDDVEVDQSPLLVWAAHYAASANGRGLARVGLTNAASLLGRTPAQARRALAQLATAARYAAMSVPDAVVAGLDPRIMSHPGMARAEANRAARRRAERESRRGGAADG